MCHSYGEQSRAFYFLPPINLFPSLTLPFDSPLDSCKTRCSPEMILIRSAFNFQIVCQNCFFFSSNQLISPLSLSLSLSFSLARWFNPHRSFWGTGNYDVNVIIAALHGKNLQVNWWDRRRGLSLFLCFSLFLSFSLLLGCFSHFFFCCCCFSQRHLWHRVGAVVWHHRQQANLLVMRSL